MSGQSDGVAAAGGATDPEVLATAHRIWPEVEAKLRAHHGAKAEAISPDQVKKAFDMLLFLLQALKGAGLFTPAPTS